VSEYGKYTLLVYDFWVLRKRAGGTYKCSLLRFTNFVCSASLGNWGIGGTEGALPPEGIVDFDKKATRRP